MRVDFEVSGGEAIKVTDRTDSERPRAAAASAIADHADSDQHGWFADMARVLLPKDAGFALHILTGYEQRSCYRYARGDRAPPADLLRNLVRGDGGETFLNFIMDGAPWWVERQREIARDQADARIFRAAVKQSQQPE